METKKLSDGITRIVLERDKDSCPICETPLTEVGFSWRLIHGEAESSCCGAIYQIKDWYVDPSKYGKDIIAFSRSLADLNLVQLKIAQEWIEPLREAIKQTGIQNVWDEKVETYAEGIYQGQIALQSTEQNGITK